MNKEKVDYIGSNLRYLKSRLQFIYKDLSSAKGPAENTICRIINGKIPCSSNNRDRIVRNLLNCGQYNGALAEILGLEVSELADVQRVAELLSNAPLFGEDDAGGEDVDQRGDEAETAEQEQTAVETANVETALPNGVSGLPKHRLRFALTLSFIVLLIIAVAVEGAVIQSLREERRIRYLKTGGAEIVVTSYPERRGMEVPFVDGCIKGSGGSAYKLICAVKTARGIWYGEKPTAGAFVTVTGDETFRAQYATGDGVGDDYSVSVILLCLVPKDYGQTFILGRDYSVSDRQITDLVHASECAVELYRGD